MTIRSPRPGVARRSLPLPLVALLAVALLAAACGAADEPEDVTAARAIVQATMLIHEVSDDGTDFTLSGALDGPRDPFIAAMQTVLDDRLDTTGQQIGEDGQTVTLWGGDRSSPTIEVVVVGSEPDATFDMRVERGFGLQVFRLDDQTLSVAASLAPTTRPPATVSPTTVPPTTVSPTTVPPTAVPPTTGSTTTGPSSTTLPIAAEPTPSDAAPDQTEVDAAVAFLAQNLVAEERSTEDDGTIVWSGSFANGRAGAADAIGTLLDAAFVVVDRSDYDSGTIVIWAGTARRRAEAQFTYEEATWSRGDAWTIEIADPAWEVLLTGEGEWPERPQPTDAEVAEAVEYLAEHTTFTMEFLRDDGGEQLSGRYTGPRSQILAHMNTLLLRLNRAVDRWDGNTSTSLESHDGAQTVIRVSVEHDGDLTIVVHDPDLFDLFNHAE